MFGRLSFLPPLSPLTNRAKNWNGYLLKSCSACDSRRGIASFAAAYRHWRIERVSPIRETCVRHAPRSMSV
jgi:hypothetical protein